MMDYTRRRKHPLPVDEVAMESWNATEPPPVDTEVPALETSDPKADLLRAIYAADGPCDPFTLVAEGTPEKQTAEWIVDFIQEGRLTVLGGRMCRGIKK